MCWISNTSIKKIAERDFYVYKIGKVIENNIFISGIKGYNYVPKCPNRTVPLVPNGLCIGNYIIDRYIIDRGYHSYKWIAIDNTNPHERCLHLGNYDPALKENLSLYEYGCIGTFIIPKGAKYFENECGWIVSSEIIYTGKYLRISNFNK